ELADVSRRFVDRAWPAHDERPSAAAAYHRRRSITRGGSGSAGILGISTMKNLPEVLRRVRCRACHWQGVWGPEEMLQALRQRGTLRRERNPELTLIVQLFEQAAPQMSCPNCQSTGLEQTEWAPDFDVQPRRACEVCANGFRTNDWNCFPTRRAVPLAR